MLSLDPTSCINILFIFFSSTVTSWSKDGEVDAFRNMLEKVSLILREA